MQAPHRKTRRLRNIKLDILKSVVAGEKTHPIDRFQLHRYFGAEPVETDSESQRSPNRKRGYVATA